MDANMEPRPSWPKALIGFALMFAVYQAAEGVQTVILPGSPLGPVLMITALILAWPIGTWLGGRGFAQFGLSLSRGWWAVLCGGLLLASLAKLASLAAGSSAGVYAIASPAAFVAVAAVAMAALTTFVPSVAEDILTRGFLLRAIPKKLGFWSFTLLSALLYTANHLWRFDWGVSEQLRLFCLGLAYGAAAWEWRTLWGAVGLHWGWNLSNALLDQMIATEMLDVTAGRAISAGAHLVMLGVVLLWVPSRRVAQPPPN